MHFLILEDGVREKQVVRHSQKRKGDVGLKRSGM